MNREIKLTSFEKQNESQNEFSRNLSVEQRLLLLNELNRQAFWQQLSQPKKQSKEILLFVKNENESLVDFFRRASGK